jgi:hypothetical protein
MQLQGGRSIREVQIRQVRSGRDDREFLWSRREAREAPSVVRLEILKLDMTPEERLEKVEDLIIARDEITAQLLELMGAVDCEEEVEEVEEEPPPRSKKASASSIVNGCAECGSPRRHKSNCSKRSPTTDKVIGKGTSFARSPRKPCDECGSTGTRHFTTCSMSGAKPQKPFVPTEEMTPVGVEKSNGRTILDTPLRLTEQEFKEAQVAIIDGLTLTQVGFSYPHVELSEIRKVTDSLDYEDYLTK